MTLLLHLLAFSLYGSVTAGDQIRPLSMACRSVVPGDLEEKKRSLPGEFCSEK